MKKILVIVGSGRKKGNTDLQKAGHATEKVFLGDKKVNGCLGCNACRYGKPCIQKDDMQEIYPMFDEADMVALASPVYYWTISARLKAFMERLYAVAGEDDNPPLGRYEKYPHKDNLLYLLSVNQPDGLQFVHSITQDEFAELLGLSRIQIARELAKLRELRIISTGRGKIKITNLSLLEKYCSSEVFL